MAPKITDIGLDGSNDQSYRYFMNTNLFNHVNIDKEKTFVPNGCATDLKAEGDAYDEMIKSLGGIDLQLLGIGLDGHIGFNEPADTFELETHCVDLQESTIKANQRFFGLYLPLLFPEKGRHYCLCFV